MQEPRPPYRFSQIRRGTDLLMSGIVESGRESGHGDIDANDPYRKSASAASDEMPRLKTRSTTGLHFSYRRLILWVCDDAFLRWEAT